MAGEFFCSSVFINNCFPLLINVVLLTGSCQIESSRGVSPIYSQNRSKIVIEANTFPHMHLSQESSVVCADSVLEVFWALLPTQIFALFNCATDISAVFTLFEEALGKASCCKSFPLINNPVLYLEAQTPLGRCVMYLPVFHPSNLSPNLIRVLLVCFVYTPVLQRRKQDATPLFFLVHTLKSQKKCCGHLRPRLLLKNFQAVASILQRGSVSACSWPWRKACVYKRSVPSVLKTRSIPCENSTVFIQYFHPHSFCMYLSHVSADVQHPNVRFGCEVTAGSIEVTVGKNSPLFLRSPI